MSETETSAIAATQPVPGAPTAAEPVHDDNALTPVHPNYAKLLRLIAIIVALPIVAVTFVLEYLQLLPPGSFAVPVLLLLLWLIIRLPIRRYHARGFAMGVDRLRVVRGILFRSDTIVPFGRVQHLDVEQGPLERMYGLSTLTLFTAGNHNSSVTLPGLEREQAIAMREDIRAHIKRESL